MKITRKIHKDLEQLALLLSYGHEMIETPHDMRDEVNPFYVCGAEEALCHMVACVAVQKHGVKELATDEVTSVLKLDRLSEQSQEVIFKRLIKLYEGL